MKDCTKQLLLFKGLESNHLKSNRRGIILSFKNLTVEEEKINR